MASLKQFSTPDWRKLSVDQPYYDSVKREYCIPVSTDIDYVAVSHTVLSNNDTLKTTVKDQGIKNLAKFYNKIDGIEDVASFARKVETELQQEGIANAAANTLRIRDYYMDSRPCSRLRYLVCVEALYWDQLPQKPRKFLSPEPVLPVEEVVVYKLSELNDLLNSVADSFIEISQNITTTRPGLDFVKESERLRAVYPSVLDLLYKNGFTSEEISGLSIQFDFGPATLDEEPTLENCLMTDEIINIGVLDRAHSPGFEELLISKLTFLNSAPIKYARTRKNLRNLKRLGKQMNCPESFGIWGRDDWWSPPASWYHTLDATADKAEGAYEFYEKYSSSRRGREIVGGLRDRQVWPYNDRKKIKTREEYEAEQGTPTEEEKNRQWAAKSKEFDFVGSVLFSAEKKNELEAEIQTATDAYDKFLSRFDTDYLERILLRLALDALGVEDINRLIFEKAMEYLDHDALWGKDGLVANCIPQFEDTLREEIDQTPGCEDPNAAVKEKILELQGGGQISAEALQTCLQTVCPPATRMFGLKRQVEGLLAYATSDLIPYDRDELCPDPPNDEDPWEGIKFDRFEYDFPNLSNLADTTMALYEEFRRALENTYDELIVGVIKQLLRMLIENIERILCNWTDMKSFGTALANATVEGRLDEEIGVFAEEEIWKNNIVAGVKSSIRDWGLDPEDFFPADDPTNPRTYDQRLTDFVNEVYTCLNPGEFRAAMRGVELGQNLQIVEMATKKNLSCINPGDMLAIMGNAGQDLNIPGPQDSRTPRRPGESICDPAYANEIEQNFRDSYADRAEENVINDLWQKEVQKLKDTARELLGLLDSTDLGCQDDLSPSFRDNDFNRNMQENASNTMLSPVTDAFKRNISDWASDIFRERASDIDFGDNPPPNAEMIREVFEQDESIVAFILEKLSEFSDSVTLGVDEPCRGGDDTDMSALLVNGGALTMYPNCGLTEDSSPRDFFLRRNKIAASGPMIEIPLPDGPLYDSLAADPRFDFFGFEHLRARQISSEQYTFSNFLLGTLAKELAFASRGLLLDPAIGTVPRWLLGDVQKDLYKDVLEKMDLQFLGTIREELSNFASGSPQRQHSNILQPLNRLKNNPAQFSELLKIEQEKELIREEFEKNANTSSSDRLSSPPLQTASVLPLIRILVRVAVVEKLLNALPVLPTIGFLTASRSPIFISSLMQSIENSLVGAPYGPALQSLDLNIDNSLQRAEEMSLRDFIAQEMATALAKIGDILGSRINFFESFPMVSVPVKAGAKELFVGSVEATTDTYYANVLGDNNPHAVERRLHSQTFIPDAYPYTLEAKGAIDFMNYNEGTSDSPLPDFLSPNNPQLLLTTWGRAFQGLRGAARIKRAIGGIRLDGDPDPLLVSGIVQELLAPEDIQVLEYTAGLYDIGPIDYAVLDQEGNKAALNAAYPERYGDPRGDWEDNYVEISQKIFEILTGKLLHRLAHVVELTKEGNPGEFFHFLPRDYELEIFGNAEARRELLLESKFELRRDKGGHFVFEKYIEFEPLVEEEFNELANWLSPQNRAALGYIRTAFEGLLVDSDMSRVQVESVEVFRSLFKRAVLNAFIQFNDFGNLAWKGDLSPILGDDGDDGNNNPFGYNAATPFDWPAWEMTRGLRNIQLLRKLELDFFVVQSFDNQLELQGRGQGTSFRGAFPVSDDLQITNDLFWGNLPLNNIFKNLKTGLRFSFVHTDVGNRDGELGLLSGLDEGLYARYIEYGEGERQFENGFPENPNVEWAKYCNIRKAYDTFLQEEGGEFGQRMRRVLTVPMTEQAASIVDLTVANFYGKKGLLDPDTRRRFTFDGQDEDQFVRPRGFANAEGLLDDLPPIAINVGNLAGLSDMAIHDFHLKRHQMIHSNPVFEVFANFAIPVDDVFAAIASYVGEKVASADFPMLEETKRNIMLMLYAMHPPSDSDDSSNAIGDSHVAKQWLLEHFS